MRGTTDWDRLLQEVPRGLRGRFDLLLRRSLKRALAQGPGAVVPQSVRTEAVGIWRRTYMRGSSKTAARRMGYERLRNERTYQTIEHRLMSRYVKRHGLPVEAPDVDSLSFDEACEAYRTLDPRLPGSALDSLAREVCDEAYRTSADAAGVGQRMGEGVLSFVRTESLDHCAQVFDDATASGRLRKRPFHLEDVTDEVEVAQRVQRTRLVEGVLAETCGGATAEEAARRQLVAPARHDPGVVALNGLLRGLFGLKHATWPMLDRSAGSDARHIAAYLRGGEFAELVAQALLQSPTYGAQFRRAVELRLRVRQNVPETPMEAYPLARTMRRRFVLHVGPTNSGKTHEALRALAAAGSGAYLGPLRLLAYEQFERLNREGCPCSLLTGEEATEVAGARHVASTVEMADYHAPIDVAVIDEAQMIADADRGHNWTAAILGVPAREVHVCCAPHAERVVRQLVELCGDELEVRRHERLVPLRPDRGGFSLPAGVEPGDALVVFSRKAVHAVAAEVAAAGLRASVIYGALPHDVRHEEARRFDEGETDVVVATDAIGMGMNLPIRRIVFVEQQKYDGRDMRTLRPDEVQQIAGRAGRFGRYEEGLFTALERLRQIVRLYGADVPAIESIPVGVPEDIALVRDATLGESIRQWAALDQPEPFYRIDVQRDLRLIAEVEVMLAEDQRQDRDVKLKVLSLATMPFDEDDRTLHRTWRMMAEAELAGRMAMLPMPAEPGEDAPLSTLEEEYRYCDLLYTYARTFGHEGWLAPLTDLRTRISHVIMTILAEA